MEFMDENEFIAFYEKATKTYDNFLKEDYFDEKFKNDNISWR